MSKIYDILGIPHYQFILLKGNDIIGKKTVKIGKKKLRYIQWKNLQASFIIPDDVSRYALFRKSRRILFYDLNNVFPMTIERNNGRVKTKEKILDAVEPAEIKVVPFRPDELHSFLESNVTDDILSDSGKEFPMWLVFLITVGIIVIGLIAVVYMISHGAVVETSTVTTSVTPQVTTIPTLTPHPTPTSFMQPWD